MIVKAGLVASIVIVEGVGFLMESNSRSEVASAINEFVEDLIPTPAPGAPGTP